MRTVIVSLTAVVAVTAIALATWFWLPTAALVGIGLAAYIAFFLGRGVRARYKAGEFAVSVPLTLAELLPWYVIIVSSLVVSPMLFDASGADRWLVGGVCIAVFATSILAISVTVLRTEFGDQGVFHYLRLIEWHQISGYLIEESPRTHLLLWGTGLVSRRLPRMIVIPRSQIERIEALLSAHEVQRRRVK